MESNAQPSRSPTAGDKSLETEASRKEALFSMERTRSSLFAQRSHWILCSTPVSETSMSLPSRLRPTTGPPARRWGCRVMKLAAERLRACLTTPTALSDATRKCRDERT